MERRRYFYCRKTEYINTLVAITLGDWLSISNTENIPDASKIMVVTKRRTHSCLFSIYFGLLEMKRKISFINVS